MNQPLKKFRAGQVSCALWENVMMSGKAMSLLKASCGAVRELLPVIRLKRVASPFGTTFAGAGLSPAGINAPLHDTLGPLHPLAFMAQS